MDFSKPIAVIAGRGILPQLIISELQKKKVDFIVLKLESEQYDIDYSQYKNFWFSYGGTQQFLNILAENNIDQIVFAGAVNKPNFSELKIDNTGKKLLAKILANKILGDDAVLRCVINFFEQKNIKVLSVEQIIDCQIKEKGSLTSIKPSKIDLENIKIGTKAIKRFSEFDVGQSVIVAQRQIIAVEGVAGTDDMIKNLINLESSYKEQAILVKLKKRKQSRKADLPTIGLDTVENCHLAKISGIAIEAKSTLILQKEQVIKKANDYNIFIEVI